MIMQKNRFRRQQKMNITESRKLNATLYGIAEKEGTQVIAQVNNFLKQECFKKLMSPLVAFSYTARKDWKQRENKR